LTGRGKGAIIPPMANRVVRSLVFACSLLLAFPPAWCCIALDLLPVAQAADDDAEEQAPAKSSCCCCKAPNPEPAASPSQPRENEAPPAPCQSGKCCWDRHTIPPSHPQQFHPDYSVVTILLPTDAILAAVSEAEEVSLRALPVSPPIHVFDCVWLC
jgi:hypothetical protein